MKKKNIKSGFTMIELILYVAITTMFLSAAILFTWDLVYGRVKSHVYQEVNQNIRLVSKRIIYEARNASDINSITPNSISLSSTDPGRDPTVIDLSNGRIRIGWGTSAQCPVTAPCYLTSNLVNVSSLSFSDLSGANTSNIKFSVTIQSTGDRKEYSLTETNEASVELRSF